MGLLTKHKPLVCVVVGGGVSRGMNQRGGGVGTRGQKPGGEAGAVGVREYIVIGN